MLMRRWERARQGDGQLVLIVGEPGLGKSRLIEEFHARVRETPHTWAEWSWPQLLQNMPLHPVTEAAVSVSVARRQTTAFRPRKDRPLKSSVARAVSTTSPQSRGDRVVVGRARRRMHRPRDCGSGMW